MIHPSRILKPLSLAILAAILAAGAPAPAAVPQTIAFQGFLSDTNGQPLDATASLTFAIYSAASGGSALWTEAHPAVTISDGVFAVSLGSLVPLTPAVALTGPRFLGTAVNGEPELPRVALQSAPFALRAATAETCSEALLLRNGGLSTIEAYKDSDGWRKLRMFDNRDPSNAKEYVTLGPDPFQGGAGRLDLRSENNPNTSAASLFGDVNGGGRLDLISAGGLIILRTSIVGGGVNNDSAVELPIGAINADELLNEPGLASATNTNFTSLNAAVASVLSRTLTPPFQGYVLALGQCVARITHTSGTATNGIIGLSDDGVGFGTAQDVNVQIPAGAASGAYAIPVHLNGVFNASALTPMTVHLMGSESSGVIEVEDVSLTLLYVPTSYGTVSPTLLATDDGEGTAARGTQTPGEVLAEKLASQEANAARMEQELAAMQAAHQAMRSEMEAERAAAVER